MIDRPCPWSGRRSVVRPLPQRVRGSLYERACLMHEKSFLPSLVSNMVQTTTTVFTAPYVTLGARWRTPLYTAVGTLLFWTLSSASWDPATNRTPYNASDDCVCPTEYVCEATGRTHETASGEEECCKCRLVDESACEWACDNQSLSET